MDRRDYIIDRAGFVLIVGLIVCILIMAIGQAACTITKETKTEVKVLKSK